MPFVGVANTWRTQHPTNRAGATRPRPSLTSGLQPTAPSSGPVNLSITTGAATADGGWVTAIWAATTSGVRALGDLTVTTIGHPRPTALTHARTLGNPTAHGTLNLNPAGQRHTRAQGNPTLSARVDLTNFGIAHARQQGHASVNTRTLAPLALDRV